MINIVLDTNVIYGNWYLKGPNFSFIEELIGFGEVSLIVPEIVVAETVKLYREEVEKLADDLIKSSDQISKLMPDFKNTIPRFSTYEMCEKYHKEFDSRLEQLKIQRIGHGDIPHDYLVDRSLSGRKPFSEHDRGYRDALIWEVILNKIANPEVVTFFLTENYKDFGEQKELPQLNKELVGDLKLRSLPQNCVLLYSSLSSLIKNKIIPEMISNIKEVVRSVPKSIIRAMGIDKWMEQNRDTLIKSANEWIGASLSCISGVPDFDELVVQDVSEPNDIKLNDVAVIKDERAYIYASANLHFYCEAFVLKSELHIREDIDGIEVHVLDWDWNDHVARVEIICRLPVELSILWNIKKSAIEEFEMEGSTFWGWCPHCNEPVLSDAAESCIYCGKSLF